MRKGAGSRLSDQRRVDLATTKDTLKAMVHGGPRFDCCADIGYAAEDTHGNAAEAADWARAHDFKSLIIVTARYHMPRALREFGSAMPGVDLKALSGRPGPHPDLSGWWQHPRTTLLLHRWNMGNISTSLVTTSMAG